MITFPSRRAKAGFTLLEITVALVIGGTVVLAATGLFLGLAGREEAIRESSARIDRESNAEQLLRTLFNNVEVSTDSATSIIGDSAGVTFRAWCRTGSSELNRCGVRLSIERHGPVALLALQLTPVLRDSAGPGVPIELRRGSTGAFRYLVDPGTGGQWTTSWSRRQPPMAMSVIIDLDTLLLPVSGK